MACVFSPPAEGNKDIQQIQEDLAQEKEDNNFIKITASLHVEGKVWLTSSTSRLGSNGFGIKWTSCASKNFLSSSDNFFADNVKIGTFL